MEITQLIGQLSESKKVENFSKEFFTLLGDLSSSFQEHLSEAKQAGLQQKKVLEDTQLKSERREELSGKHNLNVEVKLSNPDKHPPEKRLDPSLIQQEEKASELAPSLHIAPKQTTVNTKKPPQALPLKKPATLSKAPKLQEPQTQQTQQTQQAAPEVSKKRQAILTPKNPEPILQEEKIPPKPIKNREQAPQMQASKKAGPAPIKISKEQAQKLSHTLSEMAKKTAIQAPHASDLSQHIITSLQAQNSPLLQNLESIQSAKGVQTGENTLLKNHENSSVANKKLQKAPRGGPPIETIKKHVIKQVKMHLKMLLKEGSNEIQIKLKPAFLGNMKIVIGMEEENNIGQLSFHVQNDSTKEIIQSQLKNLKDILEEKSISLDQVDVTTEDADEETLREGSSSYEELKEAKKWIQSFQTLKVEGTESPGVEENTSYSEEDPDQLINIVV